MHVSCVVAPNTLENFPVPHKVHTEAPDLSAYVPASHGVQLPPCSTVKAPKSNASSIRSRKFMLMAPPGV